MAKVNIRSTKKKRGRPATGQDPVTAIRLSPELRASIDHWAKGQVDKPARSEAIRRLIETALASTPRGERRQKATRKASEMAGHQIDRLGDPSATSEERESRKQRLLKGPKEFRDLRARTGASRRTPKR